MLRQELTNKLESYSGQWDIVVIGGGATGLGAVLDAASRGYKAILFEQSDFAQGTSSRSTKLVHGGVRYLQQGNVKLVMEALKERGLLKKNAPHLVKNQSFIVPNYKWWEGPYYGLGLKVYDWMSGNLGLGPSEWLSVEEVLERAPTLDAEGLRGGVIYHDGQFDDARLAINLAQTATEYGALLLNYFEATGFIKTNSKISGVHVKDRLTGKEYKIDSKAVINATGVFTDKIQKLDDSKNPETITPSQGIHIVLDKEFLPGDAAIMIPNTDDGRVLFAVPWHSKIIVGTTDTPVKQISAEPKALPEEIEFLLEHTSRYLTKDPSHKDIKSIFAGLRPLVKASSKKTAEISRDHTIIISDSGLISILGGKWTTYRKMAEDVVNTAAINAQLPYTECRTKSVPIHGSSQVPDTSEKGYYYGSDLDSIKRLKSDPRLAEPIHPNLSNSKADIVWAVHKEFCVTLEDALSRRTRALLLDAKAAVESAALVAKLMAVEMNKDENWVNDQISEFKKVSLNYLL